ncbi:MAG: HEPN domain-containing protein [Candidatus Omnitrophica bacterium]|nr:HEPN domain-containing protein [Candidatus Omnitrophota bacterium]
MKKETEEWLKIAFEDYKSAKLLYEEKLYRMVCYHSQQMIEKILKAILTEIEIDFARTHNILDLRNAVKRFGYKINLSDENAVFLNGVYRSRYPADLGLLPSGEPKREDARKALGIAKIIFDYIEILQKTKGI